MAPVVHICGFPQGSNQREIHPGNQQGEFHLANWAIQSLKNELKNTVQALPSALY